MVICRVAGYWRPNLTLAWAWSSFFNLAKAALHLATVVVKSGKTDILLLLPSKGELCPAQRRIAFLTWNGVTLMTIGCGGSPSFGIARSVWWALSSPGFSWSPNKSTKSLAINSVGCGSSDPSGRPNLEQRSSIGGPRPPVCGPQTVIPSPCVLVGSVRVHRDLSPWQWYTDSWVSLCCERNF